MYLLLYIQITTTENTHFITPQTDENETSGYLDVRDNAQKVHQFSDDMVNV